MNSKLRSVGPMSLQFAEPVLEIAEVALGATLSILCWIKGMGKLVPALAGYLALHVVLSPLLLLLGFDPSAPSGLDNLGAYYYAYWLATIASTVLIFLISIEVFRSALASFPGLVKVGVAILRWALLISILLTFPSVSFLHRGIPILPAIADGMMRSVCVLELSMLAFFCLCRKALHLSSRDQAFGIALGFGIMSANDFVTSVLVSAHISLAGHLEVVHQSLVLVSISVWILYALLPRVSHAPVVMPAGSTIYRWNEIASALGHTETSIAVHKANSSFFLNDVEKVVEKVLSRKLKGHETEL